MKSNFKWYVCIICFLVFLLLGVLVLSGYDMHLDNVVYKFISRFISSDLTKVVKILTYIGSSIAVISITIFTAIHFKNKKYGLFMGVNLLLITLVQLIFKNIYSRGRPIDINLIEETGYSFPSGHSLTSLAFYGLIIYYIYKSNLSKRSKYIFIVLFSLLILVTGVSRIYLGVHYFTDVLGGFLLAISYLIIYTSLIQNRLKFE